MNTLNLPPEQAAPLGPAAPAWKILVVDDAPEVRTVTRLALDGYRFRDRGLVLLEAASAAQAKALLADHDDVAVAIIDVVMETEHAGLDLVRWIRQDRRDDLMRLIIRTGQAGQFPPASVLADYEINDYWEKTELTVPRLLTSLTTSLRGYEGLLKIHRRTLQLRQWADRFPDLLTVRDWNSLLRLVMLRLRELFPETVLSAFLSRNDGARWPLLSGTGEYPPGAPDVLEHLDEARAGVLLDAWDRKAFSIGPGSMALYFDVSSGEGHLLFLDLPPGWGDYERHVAQLVLQNFRAALENRVLINDLERHRADLASLLREQEDVTRELHHRFQSSLQVVLSFLDIESRDKTGISGRGALVGVERRLHVLSLLHSVHHNSRRLAGVDFQTFLQALVASESGRRGRPSQPPVEYWGVPVVLEGAEAAALALAAVEMIDLVLAPRFRGQGDASVQVVLSDNPRQLSVGRPGAVFPNPPGPAPLEWELVTRLAEQVGGRVYIEGESLKLSF